MESAIQLDELDLKIIDVAADARAPSLSKAAKALVRLTFFSVTMGSSFSPKRLDVEANIGGSIAEGNADASECGRLPLPYRILRRFQPKLSG
ncbi:MULTISPECIES: hypothetical protein [Rhizobium]|uniref:hypothetical protein n=1 Tax=Rhizobium TaxID=379 RepID=UPI001FED448F|nr:MULTISPECIES: hypothetical protein [Rhizobium]